MRELCLHLIMVTDDLITAPLVVSNPLHHGPAELGTSHVLDGWL